MRKSLPIRADVEESKALVQAQLGRRDDNFIDFVERAVFANPQNIYNRLFANAGIELPALRSMIKEEGLDNALSRLHDAGIYVSLAEFKGREPLRRDGLELEVHSSDFDNPLLQLIPGMSGGAQTSGSRGRPTTVRGDESTGEQEVAHWALAHHIPKILHGRPHAYWMPEAIGFMHDKVGIRAEKWFSQREPGWSGDKMRNRFGIWLMYLTALSVGHHIARPQFVPNDQAIVVARWLAEKRALGVPGIMFAIPSNAVRICRAAEDAGLDISGSTFLVGSEPYTEAKAAVVARAGANALVLYGMTETGTLAFQCLSAIGTDDMHFATNRFAVTQRDRTLPGGMAVPEMILTSLLPSASKLMINVETGDYATIEDRDCGCAWDELGFKTHLISPRSYEKTTSSGVTFIGKELWRLLEEVLPEKFGGGPVDYQLVEEEDEDGIPRISIVIAPSVGPVDEQAVIATVLETLTEKYTRVSTDIWRQGNTLRVLRRQPYETRTTKVHPLHVVTDKNPRSLAETRTTR